MWIRSMHGPCTHSCSPNNLWTWFWWVNRRSPGDLLTDLDQGISEILNRLWWCQRHWYIMSHVQCPRCTVGFKSGEHEGQLVASMPLSPRNCLHTHIRSGVVLHQEEPRAHYASVRSDGHSEDFSELLCTVLGKMILGPSTTLMECFSDRNVRNVNSSLLEVELCNAPHDPPCTQD